MIFFPKCSKTLFSLNKSEYFPTNKERHLNKFYLQAETSTCDTAYEEADYMSVIKMANPKLTEPNHIRVFFLNELRPTSSVCSHKHTSDEFKLFDISISISWISPKNVKMKKLGQKTRQYLKRNLKLGHADKKNIFSFTKNVSPKKIKTQIYI